MPGSDSDLHVYNNWKDFQQPVWTSSIWDFSVGTGSVLGRVNVCLAADSSAAPSPACPPQAIEGAIGGNAYQHSKVNQWTTSVVEQTLSQLTKLGKPFKYIGELGLPFLWKLARSRAAVGRGWGKILARALSVNCSQACMFVYVYVCAKLCKNGAKC